MQSDHDLDVRSLRKLKSLSWLAPDKLQRLCDALAVRKIKKRDVIFFEKEVSNQMYILLSGVAKLTSLGKEEDRVLVALLAAGEVFGISSLLAEMQRPFRCDAFTDCRVGVISPEVFVDIVLGIPFADFRQTMEITAGRWWSMVLRYAAFVGSGLRERLAAALLELAGKFGVKDARGTILSLPLTHEDLADLVGASRQKITEHLNELERQQVIVREGRRLIVIPEKLGELVHLYVSGLQPSASDAGASPVAPQPERIDKSATTARPSRRRLQLPAR